MAALQRTPISTMEDEQSITLASLLSSDGSVPDSVDPCPTIILNGQTAYLMVQDSKTCNSCHRSCQYCNPRQSSSVGTGCLNISSRTVGTDTSDLPGNSSFKLVSSQSEPLLFMSGSQSVLLEETKHLKSDIENYCAESVSVTIGNVPNTGVKKKYVCRICSKVFRTTRALKDHSPVHTGAKDYICDICKKGYTTRANLMIHKRTHEGKKLFSCNECHKSFHKKDTLTVHIRNHTGEKPFPCALCPMAFMRKSILQNHVLRHGSLKRYICSSCGKWFSTLGGLKYHESTHDDTSEMKKSRNLTRKPSAGSEKSILCQLCGKIYSNMSNFRGHELVHKGQKPYTCLICNRVYAKKDSLRIHYRTHNDERLYACDVCDYAAYRNGTLKSHKLRHTGVRPYACPKCPQTFTQTSSLSYHLKHHKALPKVTIVNEDLVNQNDVEKIVELAKEKT